MFRPSITKLNTKRPPFSIVNHVLKRTDSTHVSTHPFCKLNPFLVLVCFSSSYIPFPRLFPIGVPGIGNRRLRSKTPLHKATPDFPSFAELRCSTAQTASPLEPGCREDPTSGIQPPFSHEVPEVRCAPAPDLITSRSCAPFRLQGGAPHGGLGLALASSTLTTSSHITPLFSLALIRPIPRVPVF